MLTTNQIEEIRNILERSQNPLFFYDNDADGFCAYLILRRALNRGRGVTIKSFPDINQQYNHKLDELQPDLIVILDKAELSPKFANHAEELGIPILWIDHHQTKITPQETKESTSYFTSYPTSEPTSYIAQKIFNRQEDLWLSTIGCIADAYLPDFATKISDQFPELLPPSLTSKDSVNLQAKRTTSEANYKRSGLQAKRSTANALKALQSTELGKIARILNFSLMDTTTSIQNFTKYLIQSTSPHDILEENQFTKQAHKRFKQLNDFLTKQIQKAKSNLKPNSKILFHTYSGNTSMSSEISNRLSFLHPDKTIIVAFLRPEKANISIRGNEALKLTKQLLQNIPDSTGGGHDQATGAMVPIEHFGKFKQNISSIS